RCGLLYGGAAAAGDRYSRDVRSRAARCAVDDAAPGNAAGSDRRGSWSGRGSGRYPFSCPHVGRSQTTRSTYIRGSSRVTVADRSPRLLLAGSPGGPYRSHDDSAAGITESPNRLAVTEAKRIAPLGRW